MLRSPQFAPNFGGFAAHAGKAMCSCLTKDCMNSWTFAAGWYCHEAESLKAEERRILCGTQNRYQRSSRDWDEAGNSNSWVLMEQNNRCSGQEAGQEEETDLLEACQDRSEGFE